MPPAEHSVGLASKICSVLSRGKWPAMWRSGCFLVMTGLLLPSLVICNAEANDSIAEIALGGLVLRQSDQISLDSEDLFISQDEVRVDYRFTNNSDEDIEALVAFPLPDQDFSDELSNLQDLRKQLNFRSVVEGKTVEYDVVTAALIGGMDVTASLARFGLAPETPYNNEAFESAVSQLTPEELADATTQRLLENVGSAEQPYYRPMWKIRTTVTRTQLFPAGKTISVRHSYKPIVGASVAGGLDAKFRNEDWSQKHAQSFCIEESWFEALDRAIKKRSTKELPSPYYERWVGYVLSSGANWKGPIEKFRLVVDKGKPENLVSFCGTDVRKISSTQFEMKKNDFEPSEDLRVLIVEWIDPAEGLQ